MDSYLFKPFKNSIILWFINLTAMDAKFSAMFRKATFSALLCGKEIILQ